MADPFDTYVEDAADADLSDDLTEEVDPDPPSDPDSGGSTMVIEIASNKEASAWTDISSLVATPPYGEMRVGGQAHRGEVGTGSGFNFDDDAAAHSLPVRRVVRIRDTAASPDTILLRGRVAGKGIGRGAMPVGDARAFDVELDDYNVDLRGIAVKRWARPAETDYARVIALWKAFLKGSPRTSTRLRITYVRNANRRTLPAHVYEDTNPFDIWYHIADSAGKDFFVTVDGRMFYDLPGSTRYAASLSITDASPDGVTSFAPEWEGGTPAQHDGSEFLSRAVAKYGTDGLNRVAGKRTSVEDAHDYWSTIIHVEANTAAQAQKQLKTLLDNRAQEERTFSVAITLTSAQVGMVKYGQTVSFRAGAAGVTSPITLRIGRLMWEPLAPGRYRAYLELAVPKKLARRIPSRPPGAPGSLGGDPGNLDTDELAADDFPCDDCDPWDPNSDDCATQTIDNFNRTVAGGWGTSSGGDAWTTLDTSGSPTIGVDGAQGYVESAATSNATIGLPAGADQPWATGDFEMTAVARCNLIHATSVPQIGIGSYDPAGPPNEGACDVNLYFGTPTQISLKEADAFTIINKSLSAATDYNIRWNRKGSLSRLKVWAVGSTEPSTWDITLPKTALAATPFATREFRVSVITRGPATERLETDDLVFSSCAGPSSGQEVGLETLSGNNGVITTFQTDYPFKAGSLTVFVDGIDVTSSVTATDPSDGEFTLDFAPESDETITVDYVASGRTIDGEFIAAGDGSDTTFSTRYPFRSASLTVYVNGSSVGIASSDPDEGEFTLSAAPAAGDSITADYTKQ